MRTIHFLMGIHNHQPVGNFEFVIEDAYQKSYKPFIGVLKNYPALKLSLHFSGSLLEWLQKNHPEYMDQLKDMIQSGQIEILTGGFYDPILTVIPEEDRCEQIKKQTKYLEKAFSVSPKGVWLAERVWEPQLAKVLAKCNIEYTVLDDTHFRNAGHYDDELTGYFITEEQGYPIKAFPIHRRLRYLIPHRPPEETIAFLKDRSTEMGDNMFLMFDDGEKFGLWPGTHKLLYEEGWLGRFFDLLVQNQSWLKTSTFQEYMKKYQPKGRVYLPDSSYSEMMKWSLPSRARIHLERLEHELKSQGTWERFGMFLKGGFWRGFLTKYSEANLMHKKMLFVRTKYNENMPEEILEEILMAQANDAYWHGVFGGLYLPNLRHSVYSHLINAERMIDEYENIEPHHIEVLEKDIDLDGNKEILVQTKNYQVGISPSVGGRIFEIDVKDRSLNLNNTLTRRYEPYHERMSKARMLDEAEDGELLIKEKGLEQYLHYDWYERFSLLDHFFGEWHDLEKYSKCRYPEQGDFVNQPYQYQITGRDTGEIKMWRKGHVWVGALWLPVKVEKVFQMEDDGFSVNHCISNESGEKISLTFGSEYNINLMAPNTNDRYFYCPEFERKTLGEAGIVKAHFFGARSEYEGVDISFQPDREMAFWFFPVYTVSYSEAGFERVYQASSITPIVKFELAPMGSFEFKVKLRIQSI